MKKRHAGKKVSAPKFGGKRFVCRGRRVRVGKSRRKVARVFCKVAKRK